MWAAPVLRVAIGLCISRLAIGSARLTGTFSSLETSLNLLVTLPLFNVVDNIIIWKAV